MRAALVVSAAVLLAGSVLPPVTGVAWAPVTAVLVCAVVGLWAGTQAARLARVREVFTDLTSTPLPDDLVRDVRASQTRTKRTWRGTRTDTTVTRGAVGSVVATVSVLARYAWRHQRRTTVLVSVMAGVWVAGQFSALPWVVSSRSVVAMWVFSAGVAAVTELLTTRPTDPA